MYVDTSGIPYSDYGNYQGINIGMQRSILSVAERGLWYWNDFLRNEEQTPILLSYDWKSKWPVNREINPTDKTGAQKFFFNCADWLLENIQDEEEFSIWSYGYDMVYGTEKGWGSAHAQAVGIQLLIRAYDLSRNDVYKNKIPMLLSAFDKHINEGGLRDVEIDGTIWFEKFASPNNQKPKILNGMLFSLIGLNDAYLIGGYAKAIELYRLGLKSVLHKIHLFDLGDWTAYDIHGRPSSNHYHEIHIKQLEILYSHENNEALQMWRNKFLSYSQKTDTRV